jgi:hypothetical protein
MTSLQNSIAALMTRKTKDDEGECIRWWIRIEKDEPFVMKYKNTLEESETFQRATFKKREMRGRPKPWPTTLHVDLLHPTPPLIAAKKYCDLLNLLDYIPPVMFHVVGPKLF